MNYSTSEDLAKALYRILAETSKVKPSKEETKEPVRVSKEEIRQIIKSEVASYMKNYEEKLSLIEKAVKQLDAALLEKTSTFSEFKSVVDDILGDLEDITDRLCDVENVLFDISEDDCDCDNCQCSCEESKCDSKENTEEKEFPDTLEIEEALRRLLKSVGITSTIIVKPLT